ncbi:hypothetical protein ACFQAS_01695 [Halopenitus salinus]|uniref:MarR family transcriptional regulator n=1 Tax=Halopenitus salinus TaxID=1198295 RepID=A0ABD5UTN1_9EURY
MPSDDVDAIVELVAEHPGCTTDELVDVVDEKEVASEQARELLEIALRHNRVLEADSKYWAIRKGEYAFQEYDHPEP